VRCVWCLYVEPARDGERRSNNERAGSCRGVWSRPGSRTPYNGQEVRIKGLRRPRSRVRPSDGGLAGRPAGRASELPLVGSLPSQIATRFRGTEADTPARCALSPGTLAETRHAVAVGGGICRAGPVAVRRNVYGQAGTGGLRQCPRGACRWRWECSMCALRHRGRFILGSSVQHSSDTKKSFTPALAHSGGQCALSR